MVGSPDESLVESYEAGSSDGVSIDPRLFVWFLYYEEE